MWVDDKITGEFVKGDITAQAYRAYLRAQMEKNSPITTALSNPIKSDTEAPVPFKQKAQTILEYTMSGNFRTDDWEKQFLQDNVDNDYPSDPQIARLEKMWKRLSMSAR